MASMGGGYVVLNPDPVIRLVKAQGMLNKYLSAICISEGLKSAGVKAELQRRIIENIEKYAANRDVVKFEHLKRMLENPHTIQQQAAPAPRYSYGDSSSPAAASPRPVHGNYGGGFGVGSLDGYRGGGNLNFEFKPSPFYSIQHQLGEMKTCETMAQHRHTVTIPVKTAENPILFRIANDSSLRVMVFCAADAHGRQDIAYPHQSEIKVNGGEVKANLRGLKNKPGSTRPVDITNNLRLKLPAYVNNVEMTYALTSKKFYLVLYVVKIVQVNDLVKKLQAGKRITKDSTISDMITKARDPDIVTTSTVMSLKCPLSTLRMDLPCRSVSCKHNQCFDATSYLQLQEQGPTWLCPICNISAPFESLAVDEYVKNILKNTSRSVDQVTIEPDGRWSQHAKPERSSFSNGTNFGSDDDLVEVTDSRVTALKNSAPILQRTLPAPLSQEQSASSASSSSSSLSASSALPRSAASATSGKRPISAVIDLTSSGDEDDEPISRAPKRQFNGYGTPSNMSYRPGPVNSHMPQN